MSSYDNSNTYDITEHIGNSDMYYVAEIREIPLLSDDELVYVYNRMRNGDKEAKDRFITANLRLVTSVASLYVNRGLPYLDLVQFGNLGLMKAVEMFDINKGYKFSTYARHWIIQSIQRGIDDTSRLIRIPVYKAEELNKYNYTVTKLKSKLLRLPTNNEIAEEMNISISQVEEFKKIQTDMVSLNSLIHNDSFNEYEDAIILQDNTLDNIINDNSELEELFKNCDLDQKNIDILKLRYGLNNGIPMTIEEIAKIHHLSVSTVSRRIKDSLIKLKEYVKDNKVYIK